MTLNIYDGQMDNLPENQFHINEYVLKTKLIMAMVLFSLYRAKKRGKKFWR